MPRSTTPKLGLGVWDDGDHPGAGSKTIKEGNTGLNGNWLIIDDALGTEHNLDGTHKVGVIRAQNLNDDVVDNVTLERDPVNKKLRVKIIPGYKIEDDSITSSKIADGAITSTKIAEGAINTNHLGAVTLFYDFYAHFSFFESDPEQVLGWFNGLRVSYPLGFAVQDQCWMVQIQARFVLPSGGGTYIETATLSIPLLNGDTIWLSRDSYSLINVIKNSQVVYQFISPTGNFRGNGIVQIVFRGRVTK